MVYSNYYRAMLGLVLPLFISVNNMLYMYVDCGLNLQYLICMGLIRWNDRHRYHKATGRDGTAFECR